mmetsp:Transcript_33216/g.56471  ORF Transcript_33216/g.56471 Transcript_33216/m.56471 type:complete len:232 (-) Transcript_33216:277-972(-)
MSSSNSRSPLSDVMKYLSFMLALIEDQNWIALEDIALSNSAAFIMVSESISTSVEFNGMTILHACVRYNPPIHLLDTMIKLYPQALMSRDCLGRTPLHVAAGSRVSPKVMKLLTIHYPQACSVQDEDGRTPLHFACDSTCELFEDESSSPRGPPSLDAVRVLLSGSLESVTLEDIDEMTALEYAIVSDAPMKVVTLLQKASQKVIKNKTSNNNAPRRLSQPMAIMARIRAH